MKYSLWHSEADAFPLSYWNWTLPASEVGRSFASGCHSQLSAHRVEPNPVLMPCVRPTFPPGHSHPPCTLALRLGVSSSCLGASLPPISFLVMSLPWKATCWAQSSDSFCPCLIYLSLGGLDLRIGLGGCHSSLDLRVTAAMPWATLSTCSYPTESVCSSLKLGFSSLVSGFLAKGFFQAWISPPAVLHMWWHSKKALTRC